MPTPTTIPGMQGHPGAGEGLVLPKCELVQIHGPQLRVSWDPAQILLFNEVINYGLSFLLLCQEESSPSSRKPVPPPAPHTLRLTVTSHLALIRP